MTELCRLVLGGLETNCYLVWDDETRAGFLVDPGSDPERILEELKKREIRAEAILLTHGHFDHMLAVPELRKAFHAPVYAGEKEAALLGDPMLNLSYSYCGSLSITADVLVKDGNELSLAGERVIVMETPGHTAGSVSYYLPDAKILFSGDTLFFETFGNTKLPTGSIRDVAVSVRALLQKLPDDTRVLPGHDRETTIAHEKTANPLRSVFPR